MVYTEVFFLISIAMAMTFYAKSVWNHFFIINVNDLLVETCTRIISRVENLVILIYDGIIRM